MIFIVMGVSGSGKTTVGKLLAKRLQLPFHDADDFHSYENIQKMASGLPLDECDRSPWLCALSESIADWDKSGGAILACSALKEQHRRVLARHARVTFIYLKASKSLIIERFAHRGDHFMPPELIDSQFEALEEPDAMTIDASKSPETIVNEIIENNRRHSLRGFDTFK